MDAPEFLVTNPPLAHDARTIGGFAAWIGAIRGNQPPIDFAALHTAFMVADDPLSSRFQHYVFSTPIYRQNGDVYRNRTGADELHKRLASGLPETHELIDRPALGVFREAESIAQRCGHSSLDARHLLASMLFRTPPYNIEDYARWDLDYGKLREAFWTFIPNDRATFEEALSLLADEDLFAETMTTPGHPPAQSASADGYSQETRSHPGSGALDVGTASPSASTTSQSLSTGEPQRMGAAANIGSQVTLIGGYISDDPAAHINDLLSIDGEAAAFARLMASRTIKPPLAIGIFGEWGAGKTHFMRRIQSCIERLPLPRPNGPQNEAFVQNIVQIRFNAWHYIESNLWASLVEYIFAALNLWIEEKSANNQESASQLFSRLSTAQQLQIDALESLVSRRAEQQAAEARAQQARREYTNALAKGGRPGPHAYLAALLQVLAEDPETERDLKRISVGLGIPDLSQSWDRLSEELIQSRNEGDHARLIARSMIARLGKWPVILAVAAVLVGFPLLSEACRGLLAMLPWSWAQRVDHTNIAIATLLTLGSGALKYVRQRAGYTLKQLRAFDTNLQQRILESKKRVEESDVARKALEAEEELRKRQQAVAAADQALLSANQRLSDARNEFVSGTPQGRLNAFIRAKVIDGEYAKHLGIVASIRKDFMQLANLMAASDSPSDRATEHDTIGKEARLRVDRFLTWLDTTADSRLSLSEFERLFSILGVDDLKEVYSERQELLAKRVDASAEQIDLTYERLCAVSSVKLPRFSRIVLYIDDLDRCPSEKVVDVLQAVHLLLCFPLFVVVVAVDARWVTRALIETYEGLFDTQSVQANPLTSAVGAASAMDYLEKIFQIPYWVRKIDADSATSYLRNLAEASSEQLAPVTAARQQSIPSPAAGSESPAQTAPPAFLPGPPSMPTPSTSPVAASALLMEPPQNLKLEDWQIDALAWFAPFVSRTPRNSIRFINVYRLIVSSLSQKASNEYRMIFPACPIEFALVVTLALTFGAPASAPAIFAAAAKVHKLMPLQGFLQSLKKSEQPSTIDEFDVGGQILEAAIQFRDRTSQTCLLVPGVFPLLAPTAQRFSFNGIAR
jgi:hypothetical protein